MYGSTILRNMQQQHDTHHWTVLWRRHDGFQARLARRLKLARQTINDWGRNGDIPIEHCAAVEDECKGEFRRWHFRPDDWFRIWPELTNVEGAPDVPEEKVGD
jgi:DNA-binding transcriptional regulator YdaS (Cro superfamily)